METINDGGPAFPVNELDQETGKNFAQHMGMSQRALMAAILMHGELVTDGVPGEACDALIDAAAAAGREVEDQMAHNAVTMADALLRALAEPAEPPQPAPYDPFAASTSEKEAIKSILEQRYFAHLPSEVREFLRRAGRAIAREESEDGIPF